jgi:hypothetical protein
LEQPKSQIGEVTNLLFISPDGKGFYWVTGSYCADTGICNEKYFITQVDDSDQQQVWKNFTNVGSTIYLSPSGKYITFGTYFPSNKTKTCSLATIEGKVLSIIEVEGNSFCGRGNPWSPIEDKALVESWSGAYYSSQKHYSIWTAPYGSIITFYEFDAGDCFNASRMPDGRSIFLAICTEKYFGGLNKKTLGQRIINISDGKVTEYPEDFGFCKYIISPNSKWAYFYACANDNYIINHPSRILNLETNQNYSIFEEFQTNNPIAKGRYYVMFLTK